ncbi:phosphate regulon sensor histidine kinase PhoR [Marinobacterium sediminicola]|uniref:Phosphate regulon sensor protein PhoR n=1 Tax=Marinobacterium sediminicola TaxID=518898 RepID=A0ABY1RZE2_9GAMM|nr:phosphate regulon sensor histidine kinase PhoR [Marinobacterium sediminicola]ULG69129.1 phosphate regulon sensor histidine kinase PhoR [Marinobacterium sediminicola]SMR73590.1 PAS/PAC sensor signal transduction histidine kinase [Marinobacterium sediminicola]
MHVSRHALIISLMALASTGLLVGLLFGYPMAGLSLGLLLWSLKQVRQFNRLSDWLQREDGSEPPEADGAWGDLFDELSRLQKRSRSREQYLRGIISRFQQSSAALNDAIVIIDNQNNLEWWNRSADRLLGLKATSDRGKPLMNLLRDPRFVRYFRKGHYQEPLELPSPINGDIQLQYQITKFGEGDRLLVARDITRLMRLEQTRQDFVANASHELRTPLTVIRGYLETFLDQALPRPLERGLEQMQQQAGRMEGLVTDLLLLSRLEASHHISDEHPILIHDLIQRMHEDAEALAAGRGHSFSLDVDKEYDLLGQANELQSAFSNLVFNAVRYTPDNGHITLRWWVDHKGGHFSVSDDGIGIEAMHIPRLTERFYRIDESRSSASGGTGLGLAIVKHVLVRHDAHLSIDSIPGKGSTFTCHFPPDMVVPVNDGE